MESWRKNNRTPIFDNYFFPGLYTTELAFFPALIYTTHFLVNFFFLQILNFFFKYFWLIKYQMSEWNIPTGQILAFWSLLWNFLVIRKDRGANRFKKKRKIFFVNFFIFEIFIIFQKMTILERDKNDFEDSIRTEAISIRFIIGGTIAR